MDFNGQVKGNGLPTGNVIDGDLDMGAYLIRMQDNALIGSQNNALQLTKNSSSVVLDDTLAQISSVQGSVTLTSLNDINLNPYNGSVKVNGTVLGAQFPVVTRLRITKTPDRAPTAGNAVYEDEFIRLGWDQATASDLEIQRTTSSPAYFSFCYRAATIAEEEVFVANANQTYTLNNFGFNGGEIMECRLTPFESNTAPAYHICIHFTESSIGTDGDLDWIITRYNIS